MSDVSTDELSAYLEGDLDDESRARIEAAIANDEGLAAELEELRALIGDLGSLPEMTAPAGLLGDVMARVADLPIPLADLPEGSAANSAALQGGAANDTDRSDASFAASADDLPDNVVRLSWWIKGPAASAIAALLVVGLGVWLFGSQPAMQPPTASAVRTGAAPPEAPVAAPAMTGSSEATDALVAADDAEEIRERLRAIAMAESAGDAAELIEEPTAEVARGMLDPRVATRRREPAAAAPARAPSPRAAPEPTAEGVFVAEFERGEDAGIEVAAVEELDAEREEGSLSLEEVSFGASPAPAGRGGGATLTLASGDRAALVDALRSRGWAVAPAGQGFQVTVPEGQEQALVTLLRQHGQLVIESPMRSMRDGKARLIVEFK